MDMLEKLKTPFPPERIHWRPGSTNINKDGSLKWGDKPMGIALAYIDARDVMNRLDDACGDLWQARYPEQGVCEIGLKIDGEWLWRANGAGETAIEGEKGQLSDSFKRAAVMWGVGRYLYYLPNERVELDKYKKIIKPPNLPKWAMPGYVPKMNPAQKKEYVEQFSSLLAAADDQGIIELHAELDHDKELPYIWRDLNSAQRGTIKLILGE